MDQTKQEKLSILSFVTVERKIDWFEQKYDQQIQQLILHPTAVATPARTFPLFKIYDVSYRPFSNGRGLFYLHTNEGVFSFELTEDPTYFIETYRRLKAQDPM